MQAFSSLLGCLAPSGSSGKVHAGTEQRSPTVADQPRSTESQRIPPTLSRLRQQNRREVRGWDVRAASGGGIEAGAQSSLFLDLEIGTLCAGHASGAHQDMRQDGLDFRIFRAPSLAAGSLYIIPEVPHSLN